MENPAETGAPGTKEGSVCPEGLEKPWPETSSS